MKMKSFLHLSHYTNRIDVVPNSNTKVKTRKKLSLFVEPNWNLIKGDSLWCYRTNETGAQSLMYRSTIFNPIFICFGDVESYWLGQLNLLSYFSRSLQVCKSSVYSSHAMCSCTLSLFNNEPNSGKTPLEPGRSVLLHLFHQY